jgi:hypothetical protein
MDIRSIVRKLEQTLDFWSEEELKKLKEAFPDLRFNRKKAKELSRELNRSVTAIQKKLMRLRRGKNGQTEHS